MSADYFRVLGVAPVLGRDFTPGDDRLNGARVAILSASTWRRRFAGDPAVIGRQILLDDAGYTVIGVMPPGFENAVAREAEVWRPLQYDPAIRPNSRAWGHHLQTLARLRSGVTLLGAVLLVLAIACVNVTNLMLACGSQRSGEFAMTVFGSSALLLAAIGIYGLIAHTVAQRTPGAENE